MKIKSLQFKSYLLDKGYTLSDIAAKAGVSRNTVSSIVHGKSCSFATVGKLAKALDVSLTDIAEE